MTQEEERLANDIAHYIELEADIERMIEEEMVRGILASYETLVMLEKTIEARITAIGGDASWTIIEDMHEEEAHVHEELVKIIMKYGGPG